MEIIESKFNEVNQAITEYSYWCNEYRVTPGANPIGYVPHTPLVLQEVLNKYNNDLNTVYLYLDKYLRILIECCNECMEDISNLGN